MDQNALNSVGRQFISDAPFPIIIGHMNSLTINVVLAAEAIKNTNQIIISDATGVSAGQFLILFSSTTGRFYQGTIVGISSTTLTMDSPLDSSFPIGAIVDIGVKDLSVNGAVTPVIFGIRGGTPSKDAIQISFHITRILLQITMSATSDFSDFGDITGGLTNGLVMRIVNGITNNLFNVKTNSDMAALAHDYTSYDTSSPSVGVYGLALRLTFAGASKMGSVVDIGPGEDLQVIIQDDLSSLSSFHLIAEGHISEKVLS